MLNKIPSEYIISINPSRIGGQQVIFKLNDNYQLSAINAPAAHSYKFAVIKENELCYDTDITSDTEVTYSQEEAEQFFWLSWAHVNLLYIKD